MTWLCGNSLEGVENCCCPWEHIGNLGRGRGEAFRLQEWRKNEIYRKELAACSSKTEAQFYDPGLGRKPPMDTEGQYSLQPGKLLRWVRFYNYSFCINWRSTWSIDPRFFIFNNNK